MLQSNPVTSFPSRVLESVVLPTRVNMLFQRDNSAGQPVGSHADSSQVVIFQEINLVGQGRDMREFKKSRFFTPQLLKFRESAYKGWEVGFMVLTVEPHPVPSPKGSLKRKVKEASTRVGLETHASDNLVVSDTRLVFQEKIILEQRTIMRNAKKCFTKMNEDGIMKNRIGIEMD
jgi:hypothetical protein